MLNLQPLWRCSTTRKREAGRLLCFPGLPELSAPGPNSKEHLDSKLVKRRHHGTGPAPGRRRAYHGDQRVCGDVREQAIGVTTGPSRQRFSSRIQSHRTDCDSEGSTRSASTDGRGFGRRLTDAGEPHPLSGRCLPGCAPSPSPFRVSAGLKRRKGSCCAPPARCVSQRAAPGAARGRPGSGRGTRAGRGKYSPRSDARASVSAGEKSVGRRPSGRGARTPRCRIARRRGGRRPARALAR